MEMNGLRKRRPSYKTVLADVVESANGSYTNKERVKEDTNALGSTEEIVWGKTNDGTSQSHSQMPRCV